MVTLLHRTLQSTLEYNTVIGRTWVMAAGNIAVTLHSNGGQTAADRDMVTTWTTWLLFTTYRNFSSPNPTVPSPTPYNIPFSHNTCVTYKRRILPEARSTVGQLNQYTV